MIELESLTFKNIRCFDSEQTIDFVNRDKLVQVDGRNENTGGSSGAGKTTIFLALDYLLGISDIPATVLQSRLTKEAMEAKGSFKIDGIDYQISRSKKNGLTISTKDETISGNVKLAEEKLDQLIGIPRKIFKKMVHKKQKDGGFFLEMTAKETYEFLVQMLDLQKYIDKSDHIAEDAKLKAQEVSNILIKLDAIQNNITQLEEISAMKKEPELTTTKSEVEQIAEQKELILAQVNALKQDKINEISSVILPNSDSLKEHNDKMGKIQSHLSQLGLDLHNVSMAKEHVKLLKEDSIKLTTFIAELQSSKCPTCTREWADDAARRKLDEAKGNLNKITEQILSFKDTILKESDLNKSLERLEKMKWAVEAERNSVMDRLSVEKNKRTEIEQRFDKIIEEKNQEFMKIAELHINKSRELEQYSSAVEAYKKEKNDIQKRIHAESTKYSNMVENRVLLMKQVMVADETKRLIKSYVIQTFQETLDLIGETATQFLSAIPNMSNSTIYFEGCKETKTGSIKDEVSAIINMHGDNSIPIKSLSGGERTAIDLAVDLAVIDVIEAKSGKGADFFVIDEPFDGLDSVCKENCLEILKQVDTNKKIIMVDHSSELKEMISDIITVVKSGESSVVV